MLYPLEFSLLEVFSIIGSLFIFTIGLIYLLRYRLLIASKKVIKPFTASYRERTKYASVNGFRFSNTLLKYGFVLSIFCSLTIISWTTPEKTVYTISNMENLEDVIDEVSPPIIYTPKPPPPPPIIEPIIDEDIEVVDDTPDLISEQIPIDVDNDIIDTTLSVVDTVLAVLAPPTRDSILAKPPMVEEPDEIVVFPDHMPRFPGCEGAISKEEKELCSQKKLLKFIYDHVKYPIVAKENGIKGTCVLTFVVNKTGEINDVQLIRDIGGGCGRSSVRAIQLMNSLSDKWTPGKQRGRAVSVRYTLPIKFTLKD